MENDSASNTNTILIVIVLVILVGLGVWWFTSREAAPVEDNSDFNIDVNLPAPENEEPAPTQ